MAITRKAVNRDGAAVDNSAVPYPVTPTSPRHDVGDFRTDHESARHNTHSPNYLGPTPSQSQSSIPSVSDLSEGWVDGDIDADDHGVSKVSLLSEPEPNDADIPNALRVGSHGYTPRSSSETQREAKTKTDIPPALRVQNPQGGQSTNPFHRRRTSEGPPPSTESDHHVQNSSDIWAEFSAKPRPPSAAPPPVPSETHSHEQPLMDFEKLTVADGTATSEGSARPSLTAPMMAGARSNESYVHVDPNQTPLAEPGTNPFADTYRNEAESSPWAGEYERKHPIEDPYGGLHELDAQPSALSESISGNPFATANRSSPSADSEYLPPPGPPPQAVKEQQNTREPETPLRVDIPNASARLAAQSEAKTPNSRIQQQRSETYQIKHVRWLDSTSTEIRTTPIMVQNANGPCPLLALVNALTLSTPAHTNTPLVETLRVREQVTLGLLLDAVFDELMSGRRGGAAQELPDVGDLYSFLINLHTGLNVNPRFTPVGDQSATLIEGVQYSRPPSQEARRLGGFEDTNEMQLYGTFSIPLIHGWLPPRTHPAYAALQRSANTYEDAQNLLFREEELEDKLQTHGLSPEEQQLLEDIASTKYFLSSSATQLTGYGLDTITDTLFPGSIAILFRNDHFSTLYKHPRTGQILTLVTDAGYSGHQEIVWESLVDVSGEGSEFYSGDFRPVGNNAGAVTPTSYSQQDNSGWQTVTRSNRARSSEGDPPAQPPRPAQQPPSLEEYDLPSAKNTEQEDADLALALQLQEEEEENNRRTTQNRRREEEQASQAYISSQATSPRTSSTQNPNLRDSARRRFPSRSSNNAPASAPNNRTTAPNNRTAERPLPLPPRRNQDPEAGDDAPPPSYEDASKTQPYHPPSEQPIRRNPGTAGPSHPTTNTQSAYSSHRASVGRRTSGPPGGLDESLYNNVARRRSYGPTAQAPGSYGGRDSRDKDCIVM